MGFEIQRFLGEVDEELLCPICSSVLEEPVQVMQFNVITPRWQQALTIPDKQPLDLNNTTLSYSAPRAALTRSCHKRHLSVRTTLLSGLTMSISARLFINEFIFNMANSQRSEFWNGTISFLIHCLFYIYNLWQLKVSCNKLLPYPDCPYFSSSKYPSIVVNTVDRYIVHFSLIITMTSNIM